MGVTPDNRHEKAHRRPIERSVEDETFRRRPLAEGGWLSNRDLEAVAGGGCGTLGEHACGRAAVLASLGDSRVECI